jgi:hypothetical protein
VAIITGIVYSEYFSAYAVAMPILTGIIGIGGIGVFSFGEFKIGQISNCFFAHLDHLKEDRSDSGDALSS